MWIAIHWESSSFWTHIARLGVFKTDSFYVYAFECSICSELIQVRKFPKSFFEMRKDLFGEYFFLCRPQHYWLCTCCLHVLFKLENGFIHFSKLERILWGRWMEMFYVSLKSFPNSYACVSNDWKPFILRWKSMVFLKFQNHPSFGSGKVCGFVVLNHKPGWVIVWWGFFKFSEKRDPRLIGRRNLYDFFS